MTPDWPDEDMVALMHTGGCERPAFFMLAWAYRVGLFGVSRLCRNPDGSRILPGTYIGCGSCGRRLRMRPQLSRVVR